MAGPATMGRNQSKWRPNSAAAMNNNPMGVQSVMQPTAPPMAPTMPPRPVAPNPLPSANPGYGPPATTGGGPPTGNPPASNVPAVRPPGPPAVRPPGGPPAVRPTPYIPNIGATVSPAPSRAMADRFAQTPYGQAAGMAPRLQPSAPAQPSNPDDPTAFGTNPFGGIADSAYQSMFGGQSRGGLTPPQVPKMNTAPVQDAAPPEQTFAGSAAGRQSGMGMMSPPQSAQAARASDLRQQTADSKWRMAQSAATPLAPTPPNRFFQPQGRDPQNPSQFDVRNVGPGGGYFVDRGGQTQPRQDTSMARNVMAGQPAEGSPNAGLAMNIPGATQTLNGRVVSDPQRYGQEGVIPGANRGMTPFEGEAQGLSPDAFRVGTGGQPMIPYTPSGVAATDGRTARQTTIANRNARARGVRGSDVAQWRARRSAEMQQGVADGNDAVATAANQGGIPVQPTGQQAAAAPSPVATAPAPTQEPSAAPNEGNNQYVNPSGSYGYLWRGAKDYLNRYYQRGSGASPNFRQYQ